MIFTLVDFSPFERNNFHAKLHVETEGGGSAVTVSAPSQRQLGKCISLSCFLLPKKESFSASKQNIGKNDTHNRNGCRKNVLGDCVGVRWCFSVGVRGGIQFFLHTAEWIIFSLPYGAQNRLIARYFEPLQLLQSAHHAKSNTFKCFTWREKLSTSWNESRGSVSIAKKKYIFLSYRYISRYFVLFAFSVTHLN